jgi:hypothetical protein
VSLHRLQMSNRMSHERAIALMEKAGHLYFHSPCFDGIVSCVLAWDFLETTEDWYVEETHSVNYDAQATWLSTSLAGSAAVVDFLYHPQAEFWADHHATTFLTPRAKQDYERRSDPRLVYDKRIGSCALLLWNHLKEAFGYRNPRYECLAKWADKIDSARYSSVEEAIFGEQPALLINLSLGGQDGKLYSSRVVRLLRNEPLDRVVQLPEVSVRAEQARAMTRAGLDRFARRSRLEQEIAVFDVDSSDVIISRYAPYYFFPGARYSAGIVRSEKGASLTAMRNPWREFPSVPLGNIFERFGGGGHDRVASVMFPADRAAEAHEVLNQIIGEIRREDAQR